MMGPHITSPYAPGTQELTAITGGSQANSTVSLADVTGSNMAMNIGWYDFSFGIIHNSAAVTTGALFSVNGNSGLVAGQLQVTSFMAVNTGDASTRTIFGFNQGSAFPSSHGTTTNRCRVFGTIKVTTAGVLVLRFASEINASAITITDLIGWWRQR